jgi:sugar (pentulose or hexulose) kinase
MVAVIVSIDLGTTKITSLALDVERGTIVAHGTVPNDAQVTSDLDCLRGRSEWNADWIVDLGCQCLREVSQQLGERSAEIAGIGITGQQHGVVVVDSTLRPQTPLINWQDRRGHDSMPRSGAGRSYLEVAREKLGENAAKRTGCRLHPGFSALTLFWLKENGLLSAAGRACFIMDLFGGMLTGSPPITEPSCAGSSGLLNVRTRSWDLEAITALGLPRELFPEIREANQPVGTLSGAFAETTGLPAGIPVFAPIGDHQASYLGSLRDFHQDVLVNVGTGAQVAVYTDGHQFAPPVELRPLPIRNNLLSNVGLAGGWSYQALENFFRRISHDVFQNDSEKPVYETLNRLAATVAPGCDGLVCDPHFSGSRADTSRRGAFGGLTPQNLTPGHFARAVLEGMARSLAEGYRLITVSGDRPHRRIVAAGNALRENAVLRESVREAFGLPLVFTRHREEAAFGAALTAAVGAGIFSSLEEAAKLIAYE